MLWFEAGRILRRLVVPLVIGGMAVSRREGGLRGLLVVSGVISAFGFVSRYLSFRYRLTPEGIEVREGIFTRRQRAISLPRISHVSTHQNAVARLIGVVRVDVETEGGGAPEASFAALSLAAAEQIREHVGGTGSVAEETRVVYAASLRDRAVLGATTLQLGGFAAVAIVAWRYLRRLDGEEGAEPGVMTRFLTSLSAHFDGLADSISASPGLIVLSTALLLLGLWGLGIVASIARWHGFRVTEHGGELQLQRGALSRSRTIIAQDRTQAIEIRTGLLRNILGYVQIAIVTAGAGGRDRARSRMFVPITSADRERGYLRSLWPAVTLDPVWQVVHVHYRRQYINRGLLVLLVGVVGICFVVPLNAVVVTAVSIAALVTAWAIWRTATPSRDRTGYALSGDYLHVRSGFLSPRHWIVAASHVQATILRQNPFQRRHGIVNMLIDLNGLANNQRIVIPAVPFEAAEEIRAELTASFAPRRMAP
jgi:putative membrane protein